MADTDPASAAPSPAAPRSTLGKLRIGLWAVAAIALFGMGLAFSMGWFRGDAGTQAGAQTGIPGAPADLGHDFSLVERDGKPYAIFFGFTRCPDVCPTTLTRMAQLRKTMGADGDKFQIVFVSVDSGHDTPADVGAYVDLFGTPILGLTGNEAQIAQAAKSFRVFYQKVPVEGGYTVDHSAFVILMDRDGNFRTLISDHESADSALAELRALIA